MKAPRSISGRRHGRCTCTKTCHTKQADGRARRSRGNGGGHVAARFDPPNVPGLCFLPTAQLDCRWGSSSINPIPLKERGGKKKISGFRISLLSPEPLQWKELPFRPVDVIAIIEDSRPPWGWTGPHSAIGSAKCKPAESFRCPGAASPPPRPCRPAPRDARAARPRLVPLWLWERCLIKGSVLISVGPT